MDVIMHMNVSKQRRFLRLAGIVSIGMTAVVVAADELLQYLPQGYTSLLPLGDLAPWRLLLGNTLVVLAIPLSAVGYC